MKKIIYSILFFLKCVSVFSQNLTIDVDNILIEENADGGFHMWIKASDDIKSVLITESTADPEKKDAVYTFRAKEFNPINGNENRILDGKIMSHNKNNYFLIDSTSEKHEKLGEAFHIFIPYMTQYGFPWTRSGEIYISAGTFLNIRSFEKPFADYSGAFHDNPFILDIFQLPIAVPPPGIYMKEAVENFSEIAKIGGGTIIYSEPSDKLINDIAKLLDKAKGNSLDIVFAIDTTESMANDFVVLKDGFPSMLKKKIKRFDSARVGLLYYKDYGDDYLTKRFPFIRDTDKIQKLINSSRAWGGKDRPEAVYEALYESVTGYDWKAQERMIILIGDAPAHLEPKGKITREMVFLEARKRNITIYTVILPP